MDAGFKVVSIKRRGHGVITTLPEKLPGSGAHHWYTGAESRAAGIVTVASG